MDLRTALWDDQLARELWVAGAPPTPWPELRARRPPQAPRRRGAALRLTYDAASVRAEQQRAERTLAKQAPSEPPPRRDQYVKGAMEWERQAWKVWDTKKEKEEKRRDRYSSALTKYIGGQKIVVRAEPPALQQCAHCDLGGGVHALRRCMGCQAVAYCCKAHQAIHWQWHKHICHAVRAANSLEARKGPGAGWAKLRPRRWRRPPIEKGAICQTNCRARFADWKQFFTNGAHAMDHVMGDGGPFVMPEWDEAVASMAMCEEATFVFSVSRRARRSARAAPLSAPPARRPRRLSQAARSRPRRLARRRGCRCRSSARGRRRRGRSS